MSPMCSLWNLKSLMRLDTDFDELARRGFRVAGERLVATG